MRDDALRPAYCPMTSATARRRARAIALSPWSLSWPLSARLARAVREVAVVCALAAASTPSAYAAGQYCQHATFEGTSVERMTVCVSRQAFDNDIYVLRLGGKTALRCAARTTKWPTACSVVLATAWSPCVARRTPRTRA